MAPARPPPPAACRPSSSARAGARRPANATLDQRVDGIDSVIPADLLPLVGAPRIVVDRNFVNALARQQHLRRELGLEIESDATQPDLLEDFAAKRLVRRFHVGEAGAEQHVGEAGQEPVGGTCPQWNAAGPAKKSGAVYHRRAILEDGRDQPRVILRVELEIGILNQQDVARRLMQAETNGRTFSQIDVMVIQMDAWIARPSGRVEDASRAVARSIVGDDDFLLDAVELDRRHALEN